ncbi:MAG: lipopolysaccharide heptosyltransferase II [Verrucomicrobia bacterium]|nr:lipopolysaccharide heptosyltransferase II [Verrucomicrobiota bacterium]MBI3868126.1 lipopolysaccharide heptosyltransferase II [Verrucomicrobiota bacterium]
MSAPFPASEPSAILVRGVNWLGDAVMTTPALLRLRDRFPRARITLFTPQKLADLWTGFPGVDEVIAFAADSSLLREARRLRARRFDLGIALPNSLRSALELWLGRARERLGFAGNGRSPLLTRAAARPVAEERMIKRSAEEIRRSLLIPVMPPAISPEAHHVHHYLRLMAEVGASMDPIAPRLRVFPEELARFEQSFIPAPSGPQGPLLGLNPGAEYGPAKRWPEERFVETAARVHQATRCRWILFGGPGDRALTDRIASGIAERLSIRGTSPSPVVNLAGRTDLRELMAGMASCRAVLTNDSGPMHVAAALGTPVIVPFGSTSPELTAPGLPGSTGPHHFLRAGAPCSPCFLRECPIDLRCMTKITVETAIEAVLAAIRA